MDLEAGTSYAVLLKTSLKRWQSGLRPLRGDWDGTVMRVYNPDDPLDKPILRTLAVGLTILGRWDSKPHPSAGEVYAKMTWQGVAAHAYGQVLRQRELVARLAKLGIHREPEPYVISDDTAPAVKRDLRLSFDELDFLLHRAGV